MEARESVRAIAGAGLEGDRYGEGKGSFSAKPDPRQQCTLIEQEALEAVARDYEIELSHADTRRNILTKGVGLNHLVGREFSIGAVRLKGAELAEPCGHMQTLCDKEGARKALIHRGGLRCEVLSDGEIRVGDAVVVDG